MAEIVKWGLLVVAITLILTSVLSLPLFAGLDVSGFTQSLNNIMMVVSPYVVSMRALVNYFVLPGFEFVVSAVFLYMVTKPFQTYLIRVLSAIYRFIFK